jgi:hypothetical protein
MPYFRAGARASLGTRAAVSYHTEEFSFDGMRNMKSLIAAAGVMSVLGVAIGCGGDDHPKNSAEGARSSTGGFPAKGGTGGTKSGDDAGGAGGAENSAGELRISITAPVAASDPNEDEVIVDDDVTVKCLARSSENGDAVDPSSVKLSVLNADGSVAQGIDEEPLELSGTPTGETDEYQAALPVASVPSGPVSFRCTASGTDPNVSGSATLISLIDHGPTIDEMLPKENSAHPMIGTMAVEFTVTPTLLTADDQEAALQSVKLVVAGVEIDKKRGLAEDPESPGTYRANVDFNNKNLYPEPPIERTSIHIEATNQRTATAVTAIRDYPIIVDGTPPAITFVTVQNRAVKGPTTVEFTAVDTGAGIDEDKLEIELNSQKPPLKYDPDDPNWDHTGDTYKFTFDTGILGKVSAQITVDVHATDNAGNFVAGDSLFLWLDDVPPIVDLNPGNWRFKFANNLTCSATFDPLGEALSDGDVFSKFALVRALVFDQTTYTGQPTRFFSLTDRTSVKLYAQGDPSQGLLIDESKDGVCDALANPDLPFKAMTFVPIAGTPLNSVSDSDKAPAITPDDCTVQAAAQPVPETLCNGNSDLHAVVQHDVETLDEPVIYAMDGSAVDCAGGSWDPKLIKSTEGWICYVAVASDALGNQAYSPPLRVCYDGMDAGSPSCALQSETPPTCTANCTVPGMEPHLYLKK